MEMGMGEIMTVSAMPSLDCEEPPYTFEYQRGYLYFTTSDDDLWSLWPCDWQNCTYTFDPKLIEAYEAFTEAEDESI